MPKFLSVEQMVVFLFPMVESSLPEEILVAWQRSRFFGKDGSLEDSPKSEIDYLMMFLKQEIENEEQRKLAKSSFLNASEKKKFVKRKDLGSYDDIPTAAGLLNNVPQKPNCVFCERNHESGNCFKAQRMTLAEKTEKIKKNGVCFACFKPGHLSRKCRLILKCPVCQKRHHVLLCPDARTPNSPHKNITSQSNLNVTNEVFLCTLMAVLRGPNSHREKTIRILLDSGSQKSYILRKTAQELNLTSSSHQQVNHMLFGGSEMKNESHFVYNAELWDLKGRASHSIIVFDQKIICGKLSRIRPGPWMRELLQKGVRLNDANPHMSREVEMLIGADFLGHFLTGKIFQLNSGLTATETTLGWAVMGQVETTPSTSNLAMTVISMTLASASITELWKLDSLGIRDPVETKSSVEKERMAHEQFLETVKRVPVGLYSVRLPWVNKEVRIPENREVALRRLETITRKLEVLNLYLEYQRIFKNWVSEGVISRVERLGTGEKSCHYLPHRPVLKPESKTTPIRPVFDASSRQGRNPSLNDCMEKGPNYLELIPNILIRFRLGKVGVTSDIKSAFLNIEVDEDDRDYLRFFWWRDSRSSPPCVYRHNRVVFGLNCSPFLLSEVIGLHLDLSQQSHPHFSDTVKKLRNSFYVDNCVASMETVGEVEKFRLEATEVMQKAGMELRQWEWTGDKQEEPTSVLGLKWKKSSDSLSYPPVRTKMNVKITKREILSQLNQIFDPLGFLTPVLLLPKTLLQRTWTKNKDWDEEVSEEVQHKFQSWTMEMSELMNKFSFPRNCTGGQKITSNNAQLHVFCDASKEAYSTVVFLRVEENSAVYVQLLQAKTRVKPLKLVTIPRLELLGCTIGARLLTSIKNSMALGELPTFLWCDSTTVLAWIRRNNEWGTFVGNRIRKILELTKEKDWKFVPGGINPADLPSKGISPNNFSATRWWEGPKWLRKNRTHWPSSEPIVSEEEINVERRLKLKTFAVKVYSPLWYIRRNSYEVNLRIIAYVLRFRDKWKRLAGRKEITLSAGELEQAELFLFLLVQRECFESKGNCTKGIQIQKDTTGLMRVRTKLTHGQDSSAFRSPILLPGSHPLVTLLIGDLHVFNCHGGAQLVLGLLREKYWITTGRVAVKKVIRACTVCQRFATKRSEVPVSALPQDRLKTGGVFEVTVIDLAGPLFLKNKTKVWIVLFTCATYRCVHLELTQSLSTEDFLLAFIRFCKRKRRPETVYTDNGSNFTGAVNLFKRIDWKLVENRTRQQRIKWKFIPPTAPWWGGWWERLIRSVKDLMKRMLGFGKFNYSQLETCLCEVESAINHRPLTYVSEDGTDLIPLTPAMFIYDLPYSQVPETQALTPHSLEGRKKKLDCLMEELRRRFRKEYLGQLIQRGKEKKSWEFKVGEFVFVGRDDKKRIFWPLGRIVELIPGKDGITRVARVQTQNGIFLRPIQRLFRLEVSHEETLYPTLREKQKEVSMPLEDVRTRSGRVVRKPVRYSSYRHDLHE